MTINDGWEREHPLLFKHKKFGTLLRTQHGYWEQNHPDDGIRTLKSETLREAILEAETPFKKQKIKPAKQSKSRKKKSLAVAATILNPKKPRNKNKLVAKSPSIKKHSTKKIKLVEETELEVKNIPKKPVKKKMPTKKEKEPVNKKPATKKKGKKKK